MTTLKVEQQALVPQVVVTPRKDAAAIYGLTEAQILRTVATLVKGQKVGEVFEEQKIHSVAVWSVPEARTDLTALRELLIDIRAAGVPGSASAVRLGEVADIAIVPTPNEIKREGASRRIDVTCNVGGPRPWRRRARPRSAAGHREISARPSSRIARRIQRAPGLQPAADVAHLRRARRHPRAAARGFPKPPPHAARGAHAALCAHRRRARRVAAGRRALARLARRLRHRARHRRAQRHHAREPLPPSRARGRRTPSAAR